MAGITYYLKVEILCKNVIACMKYTCSIWIYTIYFTFNKYP